MNLDPIGAQVAGSAAVVAFIGLVVYVAGGSRFGIVLGIRPDAPLPLSPVGAKLQGLVVAYLAGLVAVGGLAYAVVKPHWQGYPTQLAFAAAALIAAGTASRVSRHALFLLGGRTAVEGSLRPDEIIPVDPVGDDVDLAEALAAGRRGEWQPAAALLAATADVDVRHDRISVLTEQSVHDAQWVEEWFAARPSDPLVTVVRAELAVQRAWAARTGARVSQVSDEQIRAFFTGLDQAQRLAERAAELAPDDPTPWATLVQIARGQQVPQEEFERRAQGLFDRAPHHVAGSHAALQTLCEKWMGSAEAMFGVARELASDAPSGSGVCLLPVMAHVEHHLELESGRGGSTAAGRHMSAGSTRTELRECVARWLDGPDGGPMPGGRVFGHNLVAYAFWLADDSAAARPHLEAIGRSLQELPWGYSGEPGEVLGVARRWAGLPTVSASLSGPGPRTEDAPPVPWV